MSTLLFLISVVLVSSSVINRSPEQELTVQFSDYIQKFSKKYSVSEYSQRLENFQASLKRIEQHNAHSRDAKFAPNQFSDMSIEEFSQKMLMPKIKAGPLANTCLAKGITAPSYSREFVKALPDSWDWRTTGGKNGSGIVTPVKNQGACGSCWTFSTTGNIESLWAKAGNDMIELSEQQLVDCSHGCSNEPPYGPVCNQGCQGGWQWNAFFDIVSWGGLQTEASYPYVGTTGTCHMSSKMFNAPIKNYTCLSGPNPADEGQMQAYLYQNGPISIALDANLLMDYSSGIIDPWFPNWECDPTTLDHALLIVGWGQSENWVGEITPFWIVKNSWSASWGENGYFRIARNINLCGLANAVSSALLK